MADQNKLELLKEADRRGLLTGEKKAMYDEAVRRGLITDGVDYELGESVRNFPSSLAGVGMDMVNAAMNPIDTVTSLAGAVQGGANKLGLMAAEAVSGLEAPSNMPGMETESFDALTQFYQDRYGSMDAFKTALMEDPAGVMMDFASFAPMRVPGLSRVAAAAEPVRAVSKTARTAGKAGMQAVPDQKMVDMYKGSAKFTTKPDVDTNKLAETAMREGIIPNVEGATRLNQRIAELGNQIDELINVASRDGARIPVDEVFRHFQDLRKQKGGAKRYAKEDLAYIDKAEAEFRRYVAEDLGKNYFTPKELQAFKRDLYERINFDASRLKGTPIKEATDKSLARGAKDAIADAVKGVPEINKELGELLELNKYLPRAANRIGNRNAFGLTTPLNVAGGSIAGEVLGSGAAGMAAGTVAAALNNPKVAARVAIALKRLKEGDIGWLEANRGLQDVRIALYLAGNAEQIISDQETN